MFTGFKYVCWGFILIFFMYALQMSFGLPKVLPSLSYILVFYGSYQLYREHSYRPFLFATVTAVVLPLLILCRTVLDLGSSLLEEAVMLILYTLTSVSSTLFIYFLLCGAIKIFQSRKQYHQWIPVYEKKIRRLIGASSISIVSYLTVNALGAPVPVFILYIVSGIYLSFLEISALYRLYKMADKSNAKKKKRAS